MPLPRRNYEGRALQQALDSRPYRVRADQAHGPVTVRRPGSPAPTSGRYDQHDPEARYWRGVVKARDPRLSWAPLPGWEPVRVRSPLPPHVIVTMYARPPDPVDSDTPTLPDSTKEP